MADFAGVTLSVCSHQIFLCSGEWGLSLFHWKVGMGRDWLTGSCWWMPSLSDMKWKCHCYRAQYHYVVLLSLCQDDDDTPSLEKEYGFLPSTTKGFLVVEESIVYKPLFVDTESIFEKSPFSPTCHLTLWKMFHAFANFAPVFFSFLFSTDC